MLLDLKKFTEKDLKGFWLDMEEVFFEFIVRDSDYSLTDRIKHEVMAAGGSITFYYDENKNVQRLKFHDEKIKLIQNDKINEGTIEIVEIEDTGIITLKINNIKVRFKKKLDMS